MPAGMCAATRLLSRLTTGLRGLALATLALAATAAASTATPFASWPAVTVPAIASLRTLRPLAGCGMRLTLG
jgi:hypothetical protein